MNYLTAWCLVGSAISLPPMSDRAGLREVYRGGTPFFGRWTPCVMFLGFVYCIIIWPLILKDIIIKQMKTREFVKWLAGLTLMVAGIFALYGGLCWYFTSDIRAALHGKTVIISGDAPPGIPAGQYQHVPGYGDYSDFTKKNP